VFAGLLADHSFETWRNVEQIVALERLINAVEEYTHAIPAEAILSLGAQETGSTEQKALIPAARARSDAAIARLRHQAEAVGLVDRMALALLNAALTLDLPGNRARVDAGTETLSDILVTMRPATLKTIELVGRLAVLSTDAGVSRLMLAYNAALWMNDALLVERNVRPIAGPDGQLVAVFGEAEGIAQQDLLTQQFERLAAPAALPVWHSFLTDPATQEIAILRHSVLGIGGGRVDLTGLARWTDVTERRVRIMGSVLAISSATLHQSVSDLQAAAATALAGYAALVLITLGLVLALVWGTRRQLARRIARLSWTMLRLAGGDLDTEIPAGGPADELGEMTLTLASFKASLIERERLAITQATAAAALLDEKERLRVTLHAIGDGMIVIGSDKRVTMMNGAAESLTGWSLAEALGKDIDRVLTLTSAEGEPTLDLLGTVIATDCGVAPARDATLIRRDGAELAIDASAARIFGQDGGLIGSITVLHDVTESRSLLNRIRQLAHFDTLTGLPNRALFHDRLAQALLLAQRTNRRCALLFLDMDRFKHVNDTLGHSVGDLLLREVAQRLMLTMRESDTVARLGGDEFVVILGDLAATAAAAEVADKILKSVAQIDRIADHEINVSFSIGIAIFPDDALDMDELLMRADAAMYQAKDSGRNVSMFFDPGMDRVTQARNQMRLRLTKALQLHQFVLLYQPKIDLDTGRITGTEALIRWYPEPGEVISPVDFIPIAEETGLILQIGDWVVKEACRQMQSWAEQGLPPIRVSINVSMRSLRSPGFVATLCAALYAAEVPARALEIEITESTAMADPDHTFAILSDIRALGVRVSIDDFGTGFSSLSHLHRLPVDTIKIDRTFVRNMMEVEDDAALVSAIIGMATTMRKHVIAEGVETEAQRAQLLRFGCHEAQGFLFSEPVEPEVFAQMLVEERDHIAA
jgi:diguanylate cyclase (GGDEF)-like protein/PAS domain S-box-containing protein